MIPWGNASSDDHEKGPGMAEPPSFEPRRPQPLQLPAVHAKSRSQTMPLPHMHSPATQRSALGVHMVWQLPQLSKSVFVSTQPDTQQV